MGNDFEMNTIPVQKKNTEVVYADIIIKCLLLIAWPVGAFLFALLRPGSRSSYVVYFIFGLLFAWNMEFQGGLPYDYDIVHIIERFENQRHMTSAELGRLIESFFDGTAEEKDLYNIFINWITQQFSSSYHTMYVIAGIPYLLLMLGSLHTITSSPKFKAGLSGLIVMFLFILPKDIFSLQNFRFATATWMAIYSLIFYFKTKKVKYAILLLITPLIHSSFFFLDAIFLLYLILTKYKFTHRLIIILFYCSIPFAFLDSSYLHFFDVSILPLYLQEWASYYITPEAVEAFGTFNLTTSRLYLICNIGKIVLYALGGILMIKEQKRTSETGNMPKLLLFYLIFAAITNYCQFIPVLGFRFWDVSRIFFIYVWFVAMYPRRNWLLLALICASSYDILYVDISRYTHIIDPEFYISSLPALIEKYLYLI